MKDRTGDKNGGCERYQRALASKVYRYFDKKLGSGMSINEQVAEELNKPVIKKFKRKTIHPRFKDNICAEALLEMESLSSKNKNVKYLLCVLDVFTKYAWAKPLKGKKR